MIPWESFKTPQDAYEWAKANIETFNYGRPLVSRDCCPYLMPHEVFSRDNFYTDNTTHYGFETLRLPVRR